ncbi:MAG: hypothetical protein ACM3UY_07505 [Methanocella sp.]|jgi:intergrase/recombinase
MVAGPNPAEGSNPINSESPMQIQQERYCRNCGGELAFSDPAPFCVTCSQPEVQAELAGLPLAPKENLEEFNQWLTSKYQPSYAKQMRLAVKKYGHLLHGNLAVLERLKREQRNGAIKALSLLAKYKGESKQFKQRLSDYDLKLQAPDSLAAFRRIVASNNRNALAWVSKVKPFLNMDEQVFADFMLVSGLRAREGVLAFNKVIALSQQGKLGEYYNEELRCLMHFQYPEFIRHTKNCYITFLKPETVAKIADCRPVHYNNIRKKLARHGLPCHFKDLRSWLATYLLGKGLLREEVDLLQGRIGKSVFMRHYYTPVLRQLGDKTLQALKGLL